MSIKRHNCIKYVIWLLTLVPSSQTAEAQGLWESIKEGAKEAWNSDTRKELWEKTKDTYNEVLEPYRYTVPLTNRKFINVIPDDLLLSMSEDEYSSLIKSSRLSANASQKARVQRVSKKLSAAVSQFYRTQGLSDEANAFEWEFNLIKGSEVNAFCMPGGKIAVYEGIMPYAADDASLAIVIGHEIAHAIAKHSAEQLTKGAVTAVGVGTLLVMINQSDMSDGKKNLASVLTAAGVSLMTLKFSRVNETEADRIGLIIAAMAGYNPESAISFWQRMEARDDSHSEHDWYSTHPSYTNRIRNLKSFMPEAKKYMGN